MSTALKEVLVIRRKYPDGKGGTKGLRRGKEFAQLLHASKGFISDRVRSFGRELHLDPMEVAWFNDGERKIVLQVDTEEQLDYLFKAAKKQGLPARIVTDSGATEFNGVPTKTAMSIGPGEAEKIDTLTKDLELY